ncbi:MAG: putative Ig domain-containing protein [Cyclobacteriaceae bacterium]
MDNANDAPFFTSSPVLSVNEDEFYQYNIITTDPDVGDDLTLKALSKPIWLTLNDNGDGTGTLTGTPLNANVGSFSIVLNVEDQSGANVNQNFTITVNNTNDAPVFSSSPVTAALQGIQYQYNVSTTDPDVGDTRTITAIVLPSWLTLTPQGSGTALLSGTPTNANLGSNPVTLRVTDFSGAISNQSFTINVDNANDPPSFTSSPVTAGTEDQLYSYSITTTDPDAGDTRVISALSIPDWLTLTNGSNGTGILSGTPTNSNVGNFSIVLNVRDALGANANQSFTLTISNVNDDPIFTSSPVTSGVQGVQYNYSIVADDPDAGDQVTLTAPILPSWLTFTNSGNGSGSLVGTPNNGNLGTNPVRLVASDMHGGSVMQEFTIIVNNTNDPPTFTSTPVTVGVEDNLYTYSITATDPDVGDVLEIKSLVIPSWLILVDHEDGTATLSGTPLNANVGLSNVVLQVEDAQGLSVNQNFTINVSNTNDPPVFVSTPVTGAIQDQLYNHTITTSDPDQGDSRTITSIVLPSWLTLVDNNNGTASLSGSPTNANLGSNPVTIRVTDFSGAATNQSFTINVDNANDAPFFTSVAITSATEDQLYSYSITTSDPDVLDTREITSLSKPDWLTLDDNGDGTGSLSGIPTNDNVGTFTIVLNVKDAGRRCTDRIGANVNQNFTLTVSNTNDPPFFTSTAIPVAVQNITYSYSVTTSDPDQGDTRTLTAPVLPAWLSFTPSGNGNGTLVGTPTNGDLGSHQVKLNIEDASGTSVEQVFTINVDNANDPPSFTSTPVIAVNEDDLYSYSISTTDPDVGDVKFITALSKPAWLTLIDNEDGTAVLSGTPRNADVGVSNVVLNVEDGIGANVNQNFSITVTNTNDAPAFTSVPVTGSIQDVQYSYSIFASDPDVGDVIVITATTKPAWLTLTDNGNGMATLQGTPTNANLGANGVTLRVTDVSGASVTQAFTINVDNQNDPPSFTSTPITGVDEDEPYVYNITTTDPDVGDTRTIEALSIPAWLILTDNGDGSAVLQGIPRNGDVGVVSIVISVSDALGVDISQNFNITVINVNDAPGFTSAGVSEAQQGLLYEYNIVTSDPDAGDTRVITAPTLPSWLAFVDYSDGMAKLSGTPDNDNLGVHNVVLRVTDLEGAAVDQVFTINVDNANDVPSFTSSPVLSVNEDALYQYNIVTSDPDLDDILTLTALSKPSWLTLTDNGDGTGTLIGTPSNTNVGITSIVLNVEDQAGANVNQNFTITVVNTNDAPSFTSTPILTAQQGLHYKYDILTTDPDVGDIRTIISVGSLPSWLTLSDNLDGTATLSGTPTNADLGDHTINLKVQDFGGLLDTQDFIIAVDNINDPPVFNSTPITVIDEDDLYSYSIEVTDADVGDEITLVTLIKPSWLNFTDNGDGTALLSGTPLNQNVGSHSVSIQATDILGQSVKQDFTIIVNNTNDAPTFISTPATTTNEDETYQYSITTSDVDVGDVLTITSSVLPSWLSFTDNGDKTALLTGTPLNGDVGTVNVTLSVHDGTVSVDQDFTLTVLNTNDAPVIGSTPVTIATEDVLYEYIVTYSDVDVGDQLSLVSASLPEWLSIVEIDNLSAKLLGTPANSDVGSISLILEVVDGDGAKDTQTFTLTVENVNDKPVFESTPVLKVAIGQTYTYTVTVTDQDAGDVVTLSAPLKPSFLSFTDLGDGQGQLSGTITQDIVLNKEVTLRATDLSGEMVDQNFVFTINNPPILSDFIVETNEDIAYTFALADFTSHFTDDPGDVITSLSIASLPTRGTLTYNDVPVTMGTSIDVVGSSIGNLKYTPETNFNGSDAFNWNASDGTSVANSNAKLILTILKVNDPPQLNNIEIEPVAYSLGDPGAPITESVIINDVDNNFIHSASVTITENHSVDDVLTMPAEANSNPDVTAIFDSGRGVLEISGKDTKSNYENFLRSVLFSSPVTGTATLSDKTITIVVNDSIDNSNEAIRIVQITEVFPDLDIVNSFTPNGDGVNDVWDIQNLQFYSDIRITIYDPNGAKVFECNDQGCVWDGKLGSKDLPAGAYLYTIDLNNGKRKYQGVVNILK